jgi:cell division septation protein DedD
MTIQVKASRVRSEADAMAMRLIGKGFEAYVTAVASDGQPLFRVRVGKFSDRGEADAAVARLSTEDQLDTWLVQLPPETAPRVAGR